MKRLLLNLAHLWAMMMPLLVSSDGGMLRGGHEKNGWTEGDEEGIELQFAPTGKDHSRLLYGNITAGGSDIHHQADRMQPRIIGGGRAPLGRHSYTVALLDNKGLFCGGVLICEDMVLTAAHCGEDNYNVDMFVGSEYVSDRFDGQYGEMVYPTKGWIHPSYYYFENDFMVYKLSKPVSVDVELITLNQKSNVPSNAGETLVALGWGDTSPNPYQYIGSDALMKVGVGYIKNGDCNSRCGYIDNVYECYSGMITNNMLCALGRGKDACQGDSGGPLIKQGNDPKGKNDVLVGVSSWGYTCAHETLPGVYARVSTQYNWIKSIVCKYSDKPAASFMCPGQNPSGDINNNINSNNKPGGGNNNKPGRKPGKKKKKKRKKKKKKKKNKRVNQNKIQKTSPRRRELFP